MELPFSPRDMRWLQLERQGLLRKTPQHQALAQIEQLSYVQIDSIHVVERAHHHVLFNRIRNYQPSLLDSLLAQRQIFEYWSHAAAYLPMTDFRFSLHKKHQLQAGQRHWFAPDHQVMREVRARIHAEGPLKAADFEKTSSNSGSWWDWQPAKKALEQLFMQGELMVVKRERFQKVFDLTERVLPSQIDTRLPSDAEMAAHLVQRYLQSHGFGSVAQMYYLRRGLKQAVQQYVTEQHEAGLLLPFSWQKQVYWMAADVKPPSAKRRRVQLLNPFDNLVIQRQRLADCFDFDYQIEVYVPAAKRRIGYYSLPILYGVDFIGQLDVKAERSSKTLVLQHLYLDERVALNAGLANEFAIACVDYARFNQCQQLRLVQATAKVRAWFDAEVVPSMQQRWAVVTS